VPALSEGAAALTATKHGAWAVVQVKRNVPPVVSPTGDPSFGRVDSPGRGGAAAGHIDSGDTVLRWQRSGTWRTSGRPWGSLQACGALGAPRTCRACRPCRPPWPPDVPRDLPCAFQADQEVEVTGRGSIALGRRLNARRDDAVVDPWPVRGVGSSSDRRNRSERHDGSGRQQLARR